MRMLSDFCCVTSPMSKKRISAISRLVEHNGGPTAVARFLGNVPVYQEVSRWVQRGWASPTHLFRLEPFMPADMTVRDLFDDRRFAQQRARKTK